MIKNINIKDIDKLNKSELVALRNETSKKLAITNPFTHYNKWVVLDNMLKAITNTLYDKHWDGEFDNENRYPDFKSQKTISGRSLYNLLEKSRRIQGDKALKKNKDSEFVRIKNTDLFVKFTSEKAVGILRGVLYRFDPTLSQYKPSVRFSVESDNGFYYIDGVERIQDYALRESHIKIIVKQDRPITRTWWNNVVERMGYLLGLAA